LSDSCQFCPLSPSIVHGASLAICSRIRTLVVCEHKRHVCNQVLPWISENSTGYHGEEFTGCASAAEDVWRGWFQVHACTLDNCACTLCPSPANWSSALSCKPYDTCMTHETFEPPQNTVLHTAHTLFNCPQQVLVCRCAQIGISSGHGGPTLHLQAPILLLCSVREHQLGGVLARAQRPDQP
jgi:hypothetical protein